MIATKSKNAKAKRAAKQAAVVDDAASVAELSIASIDAHPANPRTELNQAELQSLTASLKSHGLLQPVVVRPLEAGRYQMIAGSRRLAAAKAAGWKTITASIRDVPADDAASIAVVENIVRCDLNPVETARAVAKLCAPTAHGGCGKSYVDAAAALSRDASWIRRQIQLLELPDCWLRRVATGELNVGMSRALLPYAKRPAVLARIEDDMLANPWSWRTADDFERNAKLLAEDPTTPTAAPTAELKPMRAAPGTGERKRESRAVAHDVPGPTPAGVADLADDASTNDAASTADNQEVIATATPATPPLDVTDICAAIDELEDLAGLARIATAVQERRATLKRASRAAR